MVAGPTRSTVLLWLPVVVLPPLLIVDGILSSDGPEVGVLSVLAALVGCLPLVLRRRLSFPLLAPLLVAGIVLVLWQLRPSNTVVLIPMVALVEMALRGDRRRSIWMGVAVVPCVAISVLPFAGDAANFASVVVRNLALCLLAVAAGDLVRSRSEAAERGAAAREEEALRRLGDERLRIARDVHDVVAHALVAINVQAGVAAHRIEADPGFARSALREIKAASGEALADLRATLGVLRDPDVRAPVAPATDLGDLDELTAALRAAGVRVALDVGDLDGVPSTVHAAGYRIVQEALTNALRHAHASSVRVRVARDGEAVRIEVVDDGSGDAAVAAATTASRPGDGPSPPSPPIPGSGNGVRGMRERASALGGTLEASPSPAGGWRVVARLPIGAGATV